MKFPRILSKERLSLLSPEDKKIYEYEHSNLFIDNDIIEDTQYIYESANNEIYEDLNDELSEELFNEEFDSIYYDKELIKEIGLNDYNLIKKNIYEFCKNNNELNTLNEVQSGISADYWLKGLKLGWLGKLAAGLLTGLIGLVAWLLMKGKDRLAMVQLKKYMNKIVELIDQGVHKKRPWYSFLIPSKRGQRNVGEYNKACFRTIQETAERNMACLYTQCIYNLGFLNNSRTDFSGITSGMVPEEGSGLNTFNQIVNSFAEGHDNIYMPNTNDKILPVRPDADIFNNLKLPALPTNYKMLMSNIDYPTKAKQNPNGSLFMKPTEEILKAKASDIGSVYFNTNVNFNNVINVQQETNEDYFIPYEFIQRALFEVESELTGMDKLDGVSGGGLMTSDLTGNVLGADLAQEIQGKKETTVNNFKGNIIDSIDNYIRASVPVVAKLIRAIAGQQSGDRTSQEFLKMIVQINSAAENNMNGFLKKVSNELETISQTNNDRYQKMRDEQQDLLNTITIMLNQIQNSDEPKIKNSPDKKSFCQTLLQMVLNKRGNKNEIEKKFKKTFGKDTKLGNLFGFNESLFVRNFLNYNQLFESDNDENEEENVITDKQKFEQQFKDGFQETYDNIKNVLSSKIIGIIENNPQNWYIIKNSRERMDALKKAADTEITNKIDLICRTANAGKTDIGDKFKAALSTHPVRAEGLKGLWSRYSDDLTDRIESRIRSITGDNGNSNILDTIKQFLTVTYPNLIAIMTYYKQLYYLLRLYTQEHPIPLKTSEDIEKQNNIDNNSIIASIIAFKELSDSEQ